MDASFLDSKDFKDLCLKLYGGYSLYQRDRYQSLITNYNLRFGSADSKIFSSPGRTEISGNHTDHNGGKVLTASVTVDAICAASATADSIITLFSEGYEEAFVIDTKDLEPRAFEKGTSGLIRGVCAGFMTFGLKIGGFKAYVSSDILLASGLSSSAAFEMLVSAILNQFYNNSAVDVITCARIGQFAENKYWDKPSGLLDQMGCGVGGIISIDFKDKFNPLVKKIDFDFSAHKHKLLVVDTGGNHADLTTAYAAIPQEMWQAAEICGAHWCADLSKTDLLNKISDIRKKAGDRAALRALHFFDENKRVVQQIEALEKNDFASFLELVNESGDSSWKLLQNCYLSSSPQFQPISLCLALTQTYMRDNSIKGACRVHGGGFAGVIAVILPEDQVENYNKFIKSFFTSDCVTTLGIRQSGASAVIFS